jgi:ABC-type polysaccharide/polyol phosphate transport system ATPase subunit
VEEVPLLPIRTSEEKKTNDADDEDIHDEERPFELKDIVLRVPRGSFVAVVGRVGSGKVIPTVLLSATNVLTLNVEFASSSVDR